MLDAYRLLGHQGSIGSLLSGGTKVLVVECFMVVVAQWLVRRSVEPEYAGSIPVYHPTASWGLCTCDPHEHTMLNCPLWLV